MGLVPCSVWHPPRPGIKPMPWHWQVDSQPPGPPGKSQELWILYLFLSWVKMRVAAAKLTESKASCSFLKILGRNSLRHLSPSRGQNWSQLFLFFYYPHYSGFSWEVIWAMLRVINIPCCLWTGQTPCYIVHCLLQAGLGASAALRTRPISPWEHGEL